MKHKIYLFNSSWKQGQTRHDWNLGYAIAEDGNCLATHCSSVHEWLKHDLGFQDSNWKHGNYNKHFGEGNWELEWVEDVENHQGLKEAFRLNQELGEKAKAVEKPKRLKSLVSP